MNYFLKYSLIVFFVSFFILVPKQTILALQNSPQDSSSVEFLFNKARQHAFNKEGEVARRICREILSKDSTYLDALVLIGKTYSWDAKYDSARVMLNKILKSKAGYYDALDALIDNEYYCKDYVRSVNYCDKGLSYYPGDENFTYKKARSLGLTGDYQNAVWLLKELLKKNPGNKEAGEKLVALRSESMMNKVTLSYGVNSFKNDSPWTFSSLSFSKKTSSLGEMTLRYNYARRFDKNGQQLEFDAYPKISKGIYIYFNTGFSNKKNFPYSRFTFEPYFKLPAGFELSAGIRYMNFDRNRLFSFDSGMVMIYTGTIGKYAGNYWFSVRPYLNSGNDAVSGSVDFTIRRYFNDPANYLSLAVGTGVSPDEQQYAFEPGVNYLKSQNIKLNFQRKIVQRLQINIGAGYFLEEIQKNKKRDRYSFDIELSFLF